MDRCELANDYHKKGFNCAQSVLLAFGDLTGLPEAQAMSLAGGFGSGTGTGELCGALSGGATLLGLYAGKGTPEQADDPRLLFMIEDLVKWFKTEYGEPFGGIRCEEIIAGDSQNTTRRCPLMVAGVFQKVKELLVENGYDLSGLGE